jgi:hypothetical protein
MINDFKLVFSAIADLLSVGLTKETQQFQKDFTLNPLWYFIGLD